MYWGWFAYESCLSLKWIVAFKAATARCGTTRVDEDIEPNILICVNEQSEIPWIDP